MKKISVSRLNELLAEHSEYQLTDEFINRSTAQMGHPVTDETRKKISDSLKAYHAAKAADL